MLARLAASVAFASATLLAGHAVAAGTWSATWTNSALAPTPAGAPGARGWIDLIYDSAEARPVLFGGSGSTYKNDILQIDFANARWLEIEPLVIPVTSPYGPPCPRDEHAVEFDAFNHLYWIFGGSSSGCGAYGGTMTAGSTTTQIVDPSLANKPVDFYRDWIVSVSGTNAQYSYVSAYNPATTTLTLATPVTNNKAGRTYSMNAQGWGGTWSYDPALRSWRSLAVPSSGYSGANPRSRLSPAFAYSSGDDAAVMFGGATYNDTWALDAQTQSWVQMRADGAAGSPPRRAQVTNSMVYDSVNGAFVLFGGRCAEAGSCNGTPYNSSLNDTWVYRLSTNTWTRMTPANSPSARAQHTLSFDSANGVVVLVGGYAGTSALNDVWVYDLAANTWTAATSVATALPPRFLHAAVYDSSLGQHVIYGGNASSTTSAGGAVWTLLLNSSSSIGNVTLASSANPAATGTTVTFTATVTGTSPTGAVNFTDGATSLSGCGAVALTGTGNTRTSACSTSSLTGGTHSIVASYGGNAGNAASSSAPLSQVITAGPSNSSVALASSANPATTGTTVTFTVAVTGTSPTGAVNFTDGATSLSGCGAVALTGTGNTRTSACSTSSLTAGTHSIVASYGGNASNAASSSAPLSQVITTTAGTWSATWTNSALAPTPAGAPGARGWIDLIYDSAEARPVLFGGSGSTYKNDILQIDFANARWLEIEPLVIPVTSPYGPPCPRDEHAVEFDAFNHLYWIFGGSSSGCGAYGGTMTAGSTTTQIVDPSLANKPVDFYRDWIVSVSGTNAQYSYVSAYNPATTTLTLATPVTNNKAGRTYSMNAQGWGGTWSYDPALRSWRSLAVPSSGYSGANPRSRLSPAFAYSSGDDAAVMFGGATYNDTWALDAQTQSWVQMRADGAAGSPPRRAQVTNSMVYDSVNGAFVLFGGRCAEAGSCNGTPYNSSLNDTWVYRLSTNTWTRMTPANSPSARAQHTLSFDSANGVVVLVGGYAGTSALNDVWVYDLAANTWTAATSVATALPPRFLHAAVYDSSLGQHVIYGGNASSTTSAGGAVWTLLLNR